MKPSRTIKILFICCTTIFMFNACNKDYNVKPTYASNTIAGTWAKKEPYYSPTQERYIDSTGQWRNYIAFTFTSEGEPDVLGYGNPYVPGKGTNPFDVTRLYAAQTITSDSGYYNVTIPKCLKFIPKSPDSTHVGTVKVIPQNITIYRTNKTPFRIGIKGQGTYNTISKIFEVEVEFDESSIGGPSSIKRRYRTRG